MSRLIRMDASGHSTLAEWTDTDDAAFVAAVEQFRELPRDAGLVILRRPIAGG